TARQLLDRRAATVGTAYANDDELRAEMMHVLAEGYEKLGLFARADTLARAALDIRRTLYGELHPDLVASLNLLGWLQHQKSNLPAADTLLRQAITVGRAVFDAPGDARLARALNDLGVVSEARGDYQEATALYRESLDMRRNVLGDQNVGVAITTSNLSVVLYRQGNLNSAAVMAESALVAFRRILGDDHPRTFTVQSNLAAMWAAAGDHARAALVFREILQRRQRLLGPRHPLVGFAMTSLAAELIAERNLAEAESLLQNAIDIQRTATGTTPDQLAASLRIMGDLQRRANRPQQALIFSGEALRLARQIYGDHHRVVAELYHGIAEAYLLMGQPTRAETELRASARISQRALGPSHASTIRVQLRLADVLLQQGQKAQAERQITAIDGWLAASTLPADHPFRKRAQELRAALQ
ncbi:MAG: tetratricopeptide repeat protein, partial [Longimicrobiales bacterium]